MQGSIILVIHTKYFIRFIISIGLAILNVECIAENYRAILFLCNHLRDALSRPPSDGRVDSVFTGRLAIVIASCQQQHREKLGFMHGISPFWH